MKKFFMIALALMMTLSPVNVNAKSVSRTDETVTTDYSVKAVSGQVNGERYEVQVSVEGSAVLITKATAHVNETLTNFDVVKDITEGYVLSFDVMDAIGESLNEEEKIEFDALFTEKDRLEAEIKTIQDQIDAESTPENPGEDTDEPSETEGPASFEEPELTLEEQLTVLKEELADVNASIKEYEDAMTVDQFELEILDKNAEIVKLTFANLEEFIQGGVIEVQEQSEELKAYIEELNDFVKSVDEAVEEDTEHTEESINALIETNNALKEQVEFLETQLVLTEEIRLETYVIHAEVIMAMFALEKKPVITPEDEITLELLSLREDLNEIKKAVDELKANKANYTEESFAPVLELDIKLNALIIEANAAYDVTPEMVEGRDELMSSFIEITEGLVVVQTPEDEITPALLSLREDLNEIKKAVDALNADKDLYTEESFAPVAALEEKLNALISEANQAYDVTPEMVEARDALFAEFLVVTEGLEFVVEETDDAQLIKLRETLAELKAQVNVILVDAHLYTEESIQPLLDFDAKLVALIEKANKATTVTDELWTETLALMTSLPEILSNLVLKTDDVDGNGNGSDKPNAPEDKPATDGKDETSKTPVTGLSNNAAYYTLVLALAAASLFVIKRTKRFN